MMKTILVILCVSMLATACTGSLSSQTYVNQKYGYRFTYPAELRIGQFNEAADIIDVTPESDSVVVTLKGSNQEIVLTVMPSPLTTLNDTAIRAILGKGGTPATIVPTSIAGATAKRVSLPGDAADSYFVLTPKQEILNLTVANSEQGQVILNSFHFQ
jgi:hypothetical protein